MKKNHGLAKQFTALILLSGLCSALLLVGMQYALNKALRAYFSREEVQQRIAIEQLADLQAYIDENQLASTDWKEIDEWSHRHRNTMLGFYREGEEPYFSMPRIYQGREDAQPGGQFQPFEWLSFNSVRFSDGEAAVALYYNGVNAYYGIGCEILLGVVIVLFPAFFLFGSRKIIRYIVQLSEEIQAMEGGDLDHPITIQGADELTTLARCLDSMRITLRTQQQEEAEASAKVKSLITEMSHDLRTPLTTLLLYTEILRSHKYDGKSQENDYLNKIDTKARQIKQLSDNLFEYALVTRDTVVTLDPPARFSAILEEPLTDMIDHLQQRGFLCRLELGSDDPLLTVRSQYVRRILDNITSNILKYADPQQEICIRFVQEADKAGLTFQNRTLPVPPSAESTKVGLTSMETMMDKMHGVFRVEQGSGWFRVTLLFKASS
mgnify:FL=1